MNHKVIGTMKQEFKIASRKVRDGMIRVLQTELKDQSFAAPLIAHLNKIGYKKFDEYNEITLVVGPHKMNLHFTTTLMGGGDLTYTIPSYKALPPDDLRKRTFLGIEY
jgi:hypothetical protein